MLEKINTMSGNMGVPSVTFKYRVRTDGEDICHVSDKEGNPFEWKDVNSEDIFMGKRVVVFSLPGAFTPTCSTMQVPGFENLYDEIKEQGVDEVYVISVNDSFVMRKWMIDQGVEKIKFIPDGNGEFTRLMGMLVVKSNCGFGARSWRYAMVVNNGQVEWFEQEDGRCDNAEVDPYEHTTPENVLGYLKAVKNIAT
jgi:peroxiredoxin